MRTGRPKAPLILNREERRELNPSPIDPARSPRWPAARASCWRAPKAKTTRGWPTDCAPRPRRSASGERGLCGRDRKSTRLNSSHGYISYAVFCLKKKKKKQDKHIG